MIDVGKLAAVLGSGVCSALPGLHAWSGCDTVSALASQGKIKALKLVQANDLYLQAFTDLGSSWNVPTDVFNSIQAFTCQLYARNTKIVGANSLRYHMFCAKKGQIESGQLPPCEDSLMQHTLRANYQAAIWRRSLENLPDVPAPSAGHGWELDDGGSLKIRWMAGLPAPDVVLNLISCTCRRTCRPSDCSCILNGLKCTVVCKLQGCSNMVQDDAIVARSMLCALDD
ncbi:hypothetical protein GWK47_053388 [Chionoecetes opilio]|uniref:Tesmin/TSO1-like CXC domain-containing protein n=1 Tax=Chionoecetes opilio TaxID=41210 RepID=A0A8J4Y649_CHIOP|nr:hypothetical protein GWK47_053388 [Chionoecetes opilio]